MSQIYGKVFDKAPLSESHKKIIELIGFNKQVLELGSSSGYLTKKFSKNNCQVDIVEVDKEDALKAKKYARQAFIGSLEDKNFLNKIKKSYDAVVAADILEHLKNPEETLIFIKKRLKKGGKTIISLPNIACWAIRKDLFFKGGFSYTEMGILDKTHLRFYTYQTIQELLKKSGFEIINIYIMENSYPFKFSILKLPRGGKFLDKIISLISNKYFPNFSGAHLVIETTANG